MTQQIEKQHGKSNISKYAAIIILAILPVVLALATNGATIQSLSLTLTSGVYPIAFTLLSWGTAAKLIHDSRK
jgi:hypothetical protein